MKSLLIRVSLRPRRDSSRDAMGLSGARWRLTIGGALLLALLLTACGGSAATTQPDEPETREAPTFDVAAVRSNFLAECETPIVVDDLFCEQVQIAEMTGEGDILIVPTLLNAAAADRADAICNQLAIAHFDGEANDLGYRYIGILDRDGGNAAACSV